MTITVRVQPKSSQQFLEQDESGVYKAYLKTAPVDGKANEELIYLLSKEFGVKNYKIQILKGLKGRNKVVKLDMGD